jgi:hypothetical protein
MNSSLIVFIDLPNLEQFLVQRGIDVLPACHANCLVNANCSSADRTGPSFSLAVKKFRNAIMVDAPEIIDRTHMISCPVSPVQTEQTLAREFMASKAELAPAHPGPFALLHDASDAGHRLAHIRGSATRARIATPQVSETNPAVDAAWGYELCLAHLSDC